MNQRPVPQGDLASIVKHRGIGTQSLYSHGQRKFYRLAIGPRAVNLGIAFRQRL
jgi:hypothetical protein